MLVILIANAINETSHSNPTVNKCYLIFTLFAELSVDYSVLHTQSRGKQSLYHTLCHGLFLINVSPHSDYQQRFMFNEPVFQGVC